MTPFLQSPSVAVWVGEVGKAGIIAMLGVKPIAPSAGPCVDRVLVSDRADRDATYARMMPKSSTRASGATSP